MVMTKTYFGFVFLDNWKTSRREQYFVVHARKWGRKTAINVSSLVEHLNLFVFAFPEREKILDLKNS